jgi:IS1 family transposase
MSGPGIGNLGFGKSVPAKDSTANNSVADVVGNKTDTHDGDSVMAYLKEVSEHAHKPSKVYPTLADGVVLTAVNDAGTWTLGSLVEVVPADTITDDFDIHHVLVEAISANSVYEIVLYAGASDVEVGRARVVRSTVQSGTLNIPMQTGPDVGTKRVISANSRIRAAVASAGNNGETVTISLKYHEY